MLGLKYAAGVELHWMRALGDRWEAAQSLWKRLWKMLTGTDSQWCICFIKSAIWMFSSMIERKCICVFVNEPVCFLCVTPIWFRRNTELVTALSISWTYGIRRCNFAVHTKSHALIWVNRSGDMSRHIHPWNWLHSNFLILRHNHHKHCILLSFKRKLSLYKFNFITA